MGFFGSVGNPSPPNLPLKGRDDEEANPSLFMQIIVDGYNFIGRDKGLRGDLVPKRRRLIERVAQYVKGSGDSVLIVFDGFPDKEIQEEEIRLGKVGGVDVLYSGRGLIADHLIAERAKCLRKEAIVVSSDRALRASVQAAHAEVLSCGRFESMLTKTD